MDNNNNLDLFSLEMSPRLRENLRAAAIWGRLIAIIGFVSMALSLIADLKKNTFSLLGTLIGMAISILLYYFMYKFGSQVKKGVEQNDQVSLDEGLAGLNTYFKINGYILVIAIVIIVLAVVFGVIGALVKF